MKSYFYLAALAAASLVSCSNEEVATVQNVKGLEPVVLGASQGSLDVQTRGTGTVGDVEGGTNTFQYEKIYVLMTNIPGSSDAMTTWGFTVADNEKDKDGALGEQFNNKFYCVPEYVGGSEVASLNYIDVAGSKANGVQKYYPAGGASDFFAYHIDDANPTPESSLVMDQTNEQITIPFEMNGSQDLMAGRATNPSGRGFSAKTARAKVIPVIEMKHVLTRLTFEIEMGDNLTQDLVLNSIGVKSQNKGSLLVAYNQEKAKESSELLKMEGDPELLYLMEKPAVWNPSFIGGVANKPALETLTPITLAMGTAKGYSEKVGEALFVQPDVENYELELNLTNSVKYQGVYKPESTTISRIIKYASVDNKKSDRTTFEPGYSYHVKVIVYGLTEIKVEASVEPWVDGGNIIIDTQD